MAPPTQRRYPTDFRGRAARMVPEVIEERGGARAVVTEAARSLSIGPSHCARVKQGETDGGPGRSPNTKGAHET